MRIKGILIKIGEIENFKNDFCKREFVIQTDEEYPNKLLFELHYDSVHMIKVFKINDLLCVDFNIRGNKWKNPTDGSIRYFHSFVAWNIFKEV